MRSTSKRLLVFSLLALLTSLLAAIVGASPAMADHGASRTVINVIPEASNYGQTILLRATVYDDSTSCDILTITGCDPPTGRVDFFALPTGTFPGAYLGFATHMFVGVEDYFSQFERNYCCLPPGEHTIRGRYQADSGGNHFDPSEGTDTHRVNRAIPTVQVTQSSATTSPGQPVTFTATVSGVSNPPGLVQPTGTVQFTNDGPIGGAVPLSGSSASVTTSSLSVGTHTIGVQYSGDSYYFPGGSQIAHTVQRARTTTSLTSSPNPSTEGQPVTFRATVTAGTGTVRFIEGAATLGTGTLVGGVATFTTSALSAGDHTIAAVYGGDATHAGSISPAVTQVVRHQTTTALTSSPNPSVLGQTVTFQAVVTTSGPGTPTGMVRFEIGQGDVATTLGTATLSGGVATFTSSTLGLGIHTIVAVYEGDATRGDSESAPLTQTVVRHPTTTALTSNPNPSVPGQPVTFQAVVTTSGPGTPTGTVAFAEGDTRLGTGTLAGGVATFTTSALSVGTHTITAFYEGDANNAASASAPLTQTVLACTVTALSSGGNTLGTAGNDVICGSAAADDIAGLGGDDFIVGGAGIDRISAGDGNDTLFGGDGNDQLSGGAGNDRLTGDAGSDAASGGDGTDTCSAEARATCEA